MIDSEKLNGEVIVTAALNKALLQLNQELLVQFVNLVFGLRIMGFRGAGFSLLVFTFCFVISRLRSSEH
ncbi:hypothetical protein [Psychromonas sp. SP041]|uniref:hypothetical protein n=1 Tax=Psychromonas sp. SP041 TaxID=1365007 RepID=UPI0010C7BFC5|nr:hypothetical protein [Psychromonas sp. SP041]